MDNIEGTPWLATQTRISLLDQIFIFRTMSRLWTLSANIPAAKNFVYLTYEGLFHYHSFIHSFIHSFTSLNLIFNWQHILVYISQILKLNSPSQINNYHQYLLMEIHGQCQLFLYQLKGFLGNADACFPLFQTVRGISGVFPTSVSS